MMNHVVSNEQKVSLFNIKKAIGISFLPIFLALAISTNIDQFINTKVEAILKSQEGFANILWLYITISLISSLFFPLLVSLIACFGFGKSLNDVNMMTYKPQSFSQFFSKTFELSFLETIRSFGVAFLWSFLFIIPGLIKYGFYLLTPFVVFFSSKYHNGEVDALEVSEYLTKKFWGKLLIYSVIFVLIIPATLATVFDDYTNYRTHFVTATAITAFSAFATIMFHYFLLKNLLKYLNEYESPVQPESVVVALGQET